MNPSLSLDQTNYRSYLLRLWRDGPNAPWRASLCCVATGEQINFAGVADLMAFLQEETNAQPPNARPYDDQQEDRS